MKLQSIPAVALGVTALLMVAISCTEDQSGLRIDDRIISISEDVDDEILTDEILDEVMADLEKYDFLKSSEECPVRTIEIPEEGKYPKVVTKDFGEGCYKNEWSKMRSGKIIVTIKGPWRREGSVRKITFEDYMHGNTLVEGEKRIECMGETEEGYIWHKIQGKLKLTREKEGETVTIIRKVEKNRYLISGMYDREVPNEWLIDGKVSVEKSNGISYKVEIAQPLYRIEGCRWYQDGLKLIEYGDDLIQVDYGFVGDQESTCDSWIERWINNEDAEQIDLSIRD